VLAEKMEFVYHDVAKEAGVMTRQQARSKIFVLVKALRRYEKEDSTVGFGLKVLQIADELKTKGTIVANVLVEMDSVDGTVSFVVGNKLEEYVGGES